MYYIILIVITAIMVIVANKSSMLRNELFNKDNFCKLADDKGIKNARPSFSLGRTQLAFWTVIIVSSFIAVTFCEGSLCNFKIPELNEVNLALLGIAAGTTLVGKVIDSGQKDSQGAAISQQDYPSQGFLIDIISDEKGVSIHRLQNVIWTLVVGFIYINYVACNECELPDENTITPQLLGLMGISTGAYLGLKLNENKNAPVSPATTNEDPSGTGSDADSNIVPPPPPAPVAILPTATGDTDDTDAGTVPPAPNAPGTNPDDAPADKPAES